MNIRPDYFRTESEAGCDWMVERSRRAHLYFHWLIAGIGAGMVLFAVLADTLRMIP